MGQRKIWVVAIIWVSKKLRSKTLVKNMTNDLHHEIKSKKYNFGSWLYRQKNFGSAKTKAKK